MKLSREEKAKVKSFIQFENGLISNSEQLENDFINFMNKKYIEKYKEKKDYQHIKPMESFINPDGTELEYRTIPLDNEFLERTSIILYQESTKHYRSLGINTKNDSRNIEPIGNYDIGEKRQYAIYYQLHGEKIYINKVSLSDTREVNGETVSYQCEQVYAKAYSEVERTIDNTINAIFERYKASSNKNEILFLLLINLNKEPLDYFSYQALVLFINQELKNYHVLDNQKKVLERILLAGEVPNANQKKVLKRMLRI